MTDPQRDAPLHRHRRMGPLVAIGISAVLGAVPQLMSAETIGLSILSPSGPKVVELEPGGEFVFSVSVVNPGLDDVTATLSLIDGDGVITEVTGEPPPNGFALVDPPTVLLDAGTPTSFDVTLASGAEFASGQVKATLIITAPGLAPATLELRSLSQMQALSGTRVEPSSVTVTATRGWPALVANCDCWIYWPGDYPGYDVDVHGMTPGAALPPRGATRLSSAGGGSLEVFLTGLKGESEDETSAIRLGSVGVSGEYAGAVSLDPDRDGTPTIDLKVNVQDFFIYPLAVLAAGVFVAYRITLWREVDQPKKLLTAHLVRAGERYAKARKSKATPVRVRDWLKIAFRLVLGKVELDPTKHSLADQVYAAILGARTKERLQAAEAQVRDLTDLVEVWADMIEAYKQLAVALGTAKATDPDAAVFARAATLLTRWEPFDDVVEAKQYLAELRDQAAAIELMTRAWLIHERANDLWRELDPEVRELHVFLDPKAHWEAEVRPLETREAIEERAILVEVAAIHRKLLALRILGVVPENVAFSLRQAGVPKSEWFTRGDLMMSALAVRTQFPTVERRGSEQLLASLRGAEVLDFLLAGAITGAVFFLTMYVGTNFGSLWQYLTAFFAGASGALLINWQLLPWYRSHELPQKSDA